MKNIKKILDEFKYYGNDYWDFPKYDAHQFVHRLHNYPAVMIYPISRSIIKTISKHSRINNLFDPFMGSGTVLVEGQLAGISQLSGNDLNPLGHLITKAKTTILDHNDIELINLFINKLSKQFLEVNMISNEFQNDILLNKKIDIYSNIGEWANNYYDYLLDFINQKQIVLNGIEKINNFGYWFKPKILFELYYLKSEIEDIKKDKIKNFLKSTFSEIIRSSSNTRNGEFKIYRMPVNKLEKHNINVLNAFTELLTRNLQKMERYRNELEIKNVNSKVSLTQENTLVLKQHKNEHYDLVITSPPYGDSKTTVAYGQFSRLSLQFLGIEKENIDKNLLGGKPKKENLNIINLSTTLNKYYHKIKNISEKRALEVYSFYEDLYYSFNKIAEKTSKDGLQFWVVANRTVRKMVIPLDQILIEFSEHMSLKHELTMNRKIGNKVMPIYNSPKDNNGSQVKTMSKESIIIFKKT